MRPYQTLSELEDLCASHGGHLFRKGVRLKPVDNQTTVEVYQQWILLAVDLGYLSLCSNRTDVVRIFRDFMNRDVYEVISAFADCVALVREQRSDGFKARLKSASPHIWGFVKHDVGLLAASDVLAAKRLLQLFSYATRLSLLKLDLVDESLEAYRATERNIQDDYPERLVNELNSVVKSWMVPFDESNLTFRHGNGSVAGHLLRESTLETKYRDVFEDDLIRYAFGSIFYDSNTIKSAPSRVSQTVFVAKSYKALRTISKEPATLMYLQQGIWREIDRVLVTSPYLRRRIDVHDQVRNQELAKQGSLFRNFATIDLSAASDSVSWTLVKRVFRGTKLLRYLVATRSTHTLLPDGDFIKMKKFAPMGSALCFPIETIIFAAICEVATRKIARMRRERPIAGNYSVYGDDIIVPTKAANETISMLTRLGFSVNQSKSFVREDSWFRESCGGEYCNGTDVAPMMVSRRYNSALVDAGLTGCVDSANRAYSRGFKNLRHFFLTKLRRKTGFIPLFSPQHLLSDNYTNYHTKVKWDHDLHLYRFRYSSVKSSTSRGNEEIALRHWLETNKSRERVLEGFESNVGNREVKLGIDYGFGPQVIEIPEAYRSRRHNPDA